jgi:hypothetical protein
LRRIIKHANRRLYDTQRRRTITLLEVSELALEGAEFAVLDKASGEDITALVLIQSILERLRHRPAGAIGGGDARRLISALERAIGSETVVAGEQFDSDPKQALAGHAGTAGGAA